MKLPIRIILSVLLVLGFSNSNLNAQVNYIPLNDSLNDKYNYKYKTRLLPSLIVPGILIGYGLTTMHDHGIYSSEDARRDIRDAFPDFNSGLDDIMLLVPYAELAALNILRIKCRNDWINTSLLILKSELIMTAIVFPLKNWTHQLRPDSSNYESLPSGHTAQAFVAASIVHKEYRYKSLWYGVGAYGIATTVALFRMFNDKHWESDVLVGAGIGMLSAHIAYATHKHKWGRKEMCLYPFNVGNIKGLSFALTL